MFARKVENVEPLPPAPLTHPSPTRGPSRSATATCARTGSAASSAADASGSPPSGTAYVVTQLWSGANTSITLLAEDTA